MSVTRDIARSYVTPRIVLRARLRGASEVSALAILFVACLLLFVAQTPALQRAALESPAISLAERMGGAFVGWLFIAPFAFYLIAALSRILLRVVGGAGDWFGARMALFWALMCSVPLWLLCGLLAGFVGPRAIVTSTVGVGASLALLIIWIAGLIETQFSKKDAS